MNVRMVLSVLFFFALIWSMPAVGVAEKGVPQEKSRNHGVGAPNETSKEKAVRKYPQENKSAVPEQKKPLKKEPPANKQAPPNAKAAQQKQSEPPKGKTKSLPEQANAKAKENQKKKVDESPVKEEKTISESKPIHNGTKEKRIIIKRKQQPLPQEEVEDPHPSKEIKTVKVVKDEERKPVNDVPENLPEKKEAEAYISQLTQSGKTSQGKTSEHQGNSKAFYDFIGNSFEEIKVTFLEAYVMRQHIYRSQWSNAPPAPPPRMSSFF